MAKVFISYSRKDLSFVEKIVADLKKSGLDIWHDVSSLGGGSRWRIEIENAIRSSQFVIVVLSPDSIASEWVEREFLFASNLKRKIIPLMYRSCELPLNYLNLNYIDVQEENYVQNFDEILKALSVESTAIAFPASKVKNSSNKLKTEYVIAFIGGIATIVAAFISSPVLGKLLASETALPTLFIAEMTSTSIVVDAKSLPTLSITETSTITPTPEPGVTLVNSEEVLNTAGSFKTLGQLAVEKYSLEQRNKINNTLTFTIESASEQPIVWRWFWCAVTESILDQNLSKMDVIFEADGQVIPHENLASVKFKNNDPALENWLCFTYETILKDWTPGEHKLLQTVVYKAAINDGQDTYPAGYKAYEYTITITP